MDDLMIGDTGLPLDAEKAISDMLNTLGEKYYFAQGDSAAFWSIALLMKQHLGRGKK